MADSADMTAAMRLIDQAKDRGFVFQRIAPGPDGPLREMWDTMQWRDEIYLG